MGLKARKPQNIVYRVQRSVGEEEGGRRAKRRRNQEEEDYDEDYD